MANTIAPATFSVSSRYEYGNCRDGFNHFGYLYINGVLASQSKCHYINRTWECYPGQSARQAACYEWMQARENELKEIAKANCGVQRTTPKVKAMLATMMAEDAQYKAVKDHYESL